MASVRLDPNEQNDSDEIVYMESGAVDYRDPYSQATGYFESDHTNISDDDIRNYEAGDFSLPSGSFTRVAGSGLVEEYENTEAVVQRRLAEANALINVGGTMETQAQAAYQLEVDETNQTRRRLNQVSDDFEQDYTDLYNAYDRQSQVQEDLDASMDRLRVMQEYGSSGGIYASLTSSFNMPQLQRDVAVQRARMRRATRDATQAEIELQQSSMQQEKLFNDLEREEREDDEKLYNLQMIQQDLTDNQKEQDLLENDLENIQEAKQRVVGRIQQVTDVVNQSLAGLDAARMTPTRFRPGSTKPLPRSVDPAFRHNANIQRQQFDVYRRGYQGLSDMGLSESEIFQHLGDPDSLSSQYSSFNNFGISSLIDDALQNAFTPSGLIGISANPYGFLTGLASNIAFGDPYASKPQAPDLFSYETAYNAVLAFGANDKVLHAKIGDLFGNLSKSYYQSQGMKGIDANNKAYRQGLMLGGGIELFQLFTGSGEATFGDAAATILGVGNALSTPTFYDNTQAILNDPNPLFSTSQLRNMFNLGSQVNQAVGTVGAIIDDVTSRYSNPPPKPKPKPKPPRFNFGDNTTPNNNQFV